VGSGLDDLYRDIILDHYRHPRNKGRLDQPDIANQGENPLCGDEIEISLKIDGDRVVDVGFSGHGCSISQASASMMTEVIKGKPIAEVEALVGGFQGMMRGEDAPDSEAFDDLESLQGVRKYPVRVKCALLSWTTLAETLQLYQQAAKKAE
jgi:nitrogen fixation protein NifU and related proteins